MDIFEKYIKSNRRNEDCRALTCESYKKFYEKHFRKVYDKKTNFELATYGDALLKFALCSILLDEVTQLSEEKKKYEKDEYLIKVVAKHYDLLEYMNFDREDERIRSEYSYYPDKKNDQDDGDSQDDEDSLDKKDKQGKKNNLTKYIATTVEAVLGAIYLENHNFEEIRELVRSWIALSE